MKLYIVLDDQAMKPRHYNRYIISNVIVLYINILGFGVENRVIYQYNRALIIIMKNNCFDFIPF